jgi:hypothetical protein
VSAVRAGAGVPPFGNWPVIASDLEIDPCQRYDLEGQDGGDQFETPAAADQQMNWWVTCTDRRKDRGLRPDRAQGAHELEAKEHDLPLVRQRRA